MVWKVDLHPAFFEDFKKLPEEVREELGVLMMVLEEVGPNLKRPRSDTLGGSKHANMKELRFAADNGVWRVAYAFDPLREAILLVAGDKSGVVQRRFYKSLIDRADARFDQHLLALKVKGP